MARLLGLACGLLLVLGAVVASSCALAANGTFSSEAVAYQQCASDAGVSSQGMGGGYSYVCTYVGFGVSATAGCSSGFYSGHYQYVRKPDNFNPSIGDYRWCVPASCPSGSSAGVSGGTTAPRNTDGVGCCATWSETGSVSYGGQTWGEYSGQRTGSYCNEQYSPTSPPAGAPQSPNPPKMCDSGQKSCYDPNKHTACYTTESGEQICTQLNQADNCATGATGSLCYGKDGTPPPAPSDPPISSGQPPNSSAQATSTGSSGGDNFTQNNYSGTSPGGAPSSTSDGSTGSQSNQNGSGNTAGPGHGTDSSGKCPDGSVPTASGCSGTFTDTNCDTPPRCFGDAVLCGQAKELWAIKCNTAKPSSSSSSGLTLGDPSSALAAAGVPADGGASSDPSSSGLVTSSDIGQDGFDSSGLGFSRSCPANPTFNVLGHAYSLDLTPFCNFASLLGWFVLLVAFLVGLRIVATGKA